jgi:hypothetical protein
MLVFQNSKAMYNLGDEIFKILLENSTHAMVKGEEKKSTNVQLKVGIFSTRHS